MATARMLATGVLDSPTCRNFRSAVALAFAAIGLGALIYLIEKYGLEPPRRFVENPADVMMRAVGLAHFWVGWLYLFSSPRLRTKSAFANLTLWTLLGAALCWMSWSNGGMKNPFLVMAFYAYFLVHEIRDQGNLFVACGDAPMLPMREAFLNRLTASVTLSLVVILVTTYSVHGRVTEKLEDAAVDPGRWLVTVVGGAWILAVASWVRTLRFAWRHGIEWSGFGPLLAVYASIGSLLALGMLVGSFGFNLIVLIHVAAWFVFTLQRLQQRPAPAPGLWGWLRTTPAGFITLHAGAMLLVLALMALRVHLWERTGWLSTAFATSSFHYWSIMHITMAFWRGR